MDREYLDKINKIAKNIWNEKNVIESVIPLKKGMTNSSFLVTVAGKKFIFRINGLGTSKLINREQEKINYQLISKLHISDKIIDINSSEGYKVTKYEEDVKTCDPYNKKEVCQCLSTLKHLHSLKLEVPHVFDIFKSIDFYQSLWKRRHSKYKDYNVVKKQVFFFKSFIKKHQNDFIFSHIDPVADNFLLKKDGTVLLIDWEYAAMCDPYIDLAMFALYAGYSKSDFDWFLQCYFETEIPLQKRLLIYCYIAAGGLLWSNWCEYKADLGISFGNYAQQQYDYAKIYSTEVLTYLKDGSL